jgi:hypothetical protein
MYICIYIYPPGPSALKRVNGSRAFSLRIKDRGFRIEDRSFRGRSFPLLQSSPAAPAQLLKVLVELVLGPVKKTKTIKHLWFFILVGTGGRADFDRIGVSSRRNARTERKKQNKKSFVCGRPSLSLFSSFRFVRSASTKPHIWNRTGVSPRRNTNSPKIV